MNPETLRKFIGKFPDLCVECWACKGTGEIRSLGSLTWVDCRQCFRLGKLPNLLKIVEYLLETHDPKK